MSCTGEQVIGEIVSDTTGVRLSNYAVACSNWTGTGGTLSTAKIGPFATTFIRLVYLGSSQWRFDTSPDDINWRKGASTVTQSSFTPSHVGYYSRDAGSGLESVASFEFLRRVSGIS